MKLAKAVFAVSAPCSKQSQHEPREFSLPKEVQVQKRHALMSLQETHRISLTLLSILRTSCSHSTSRIQYSLFRGLKRFRLPPSYSMNAAPAFPNTPQTMLKLSRHITFGTSKAWFLCMMEGSCLIRVTIVHMASTANSFLLAVFHCLYGPAHPAGLVDLLIFMTIPFLQQPCHPQIPLLLSKATCNLSMNAKQINLHKTFKVWNSVCGKGAQVFWISALVSWAKRPCNS